jgi:hypothetical protein
MDSNIKPWYTKSLKDLNPEERKKSWIFFGVIAVACFFIFYFLLGGGNREKKWYDNPTCCNCYGTGKVTVYGSTINCPYCYGSGHLSEATYERKCK